MEDICKCECHVKGSAVMHFMACCQFTYEKYISIDGSIDMLAYNKIANPNVPAEVIEFISNSNSDAGFVTHPNGMYHWKAKATGVIEVQCP